MLAWVRYVRRFTLRPKPPVPFTAELPAYPEEGGRARVRDADPERASRSA